MRTNGLGTPGTPELLEAIAQVKHDLGLRSISDVLATSVFMLAVLASDPDSWLRRSPRVTIGDLHMDALRLRTATRERLRAAAAQAQSE